MATSNKVNRAFLFILLLASSCTSSEKTSLYNTVHVQASNGYTFYKNIDFFHMKGINQINVNDNSKIFDFPYYSIYKERDKIILINYISCSYQKTTEYKVLKEYAISTCIDEDKEDCTYTRTIDIIYSNKRILYEYIIFDNYEYLQRISLKYRDKNDLIYENSENSYYNYLLDIDEDSIKYNFKTLNVVH